MKNENAKDFYHVKVIFFADNTPYQMVIPFEDYDDAEFYVNNVLTVKDAVIITEDKVNFFYIAPDGSRKWFKDYPWYVDASELAGVIISYKAKYLYKKIEWPEICSEFITLK